MSTIIYLILNLILSFSITLVVIPYFIEWAFKEKWFDPINKRKVHQGLIPRIGGMAFIPSALLVYAIMLVVATFLGDVCWDESYGNQLTLSSGICTSVAIGMIYVEGLYDDMKEAGYKVKFLVHFLSALLIVISGVWLNDFYGLFGINEIPWFVGMPFTVMFFMYVISAINLIDGIDGLCAGLSGIAFFYLGILFYCDGRLPETMLSFSLLGVLVAYFDFNVYGKTQKHNKIFMGDCGSQVLGLLLALLVVRYAMNVENKAVSNNALVLSISPLVIPCLDVIRVMIGRISRGDNPFLPDNTHIHHLLLAKGWNQRKTRNFIFFIVIFLILFNLLFSHSINLIFIADIALYMGLLLWIRKSLRKKRRTN